jgi:hypothetical protein
VLLGVALMAGRFRTWPPLLRHLALIGFVVDAVLAIGLQIFLEAKAPPLGLNAVAMQNWILKQRFAVEFIGDRFASVSIVVAVLAVSGAIALLAFTKTEGDSRNA